MNVAIPVDGLSSRLSKETEVRPKSRVKIGGKPFLGHILRHYPHHRFSDFVLALEGKGHSLKKYIHGLLSNQMGPYVGDYMFLFSWGEVFPRSVFPVCWSFTKNTDVWRQSLRFIRPSLPAESMVPSLYSKRKFPNTSIEMKRDERRASSKALHQMGGKWPTRSSRSGNVWTHLDSKLLERLWKFGNVPWKTWR